MDETRCKKALMMMGVGEKRNEGWFFDKMGLLQLEMDELVKRGYLLYCPKDPDNFMSDPQYMLTKKGREYVWKNADND